MIVTIKTKKEIFDNTKEWLELYKEEKCKDTKIIIKDISEVEKKIEQFVQKELGCRFDSSLGEASPDLYNSLIYHSIGETEHIQLNMRVEYKGKKVVFPKYFSKTEESKHFNTFNHLEIVA